MRQFNKGLIDILVSTIVIEVGIDIPNATVMIIEHAERFGLSQLHQLRGRVGRGSEQSYCVLMTDRKKFYGGGRKSEDDRQIISFTRKRLQTMCETNDGFKISEVDLELRGPGDFWGTKQHGFPELRIANLLTDAAILTLARSEAQQIVASDPQLRMEEHLLLRTKLTPFLKDKMKLSTIA
jgi:ATP-dependent DNA helicase RecG